MQIKSPLKAIRAKCVDCSGGSLLPDAIGGVSQAVTPSQTCTDAGYSHFQTVTNQKNVTDKKEFSEASTADCYDVTGKNGGATETTQIIEELF